jgi:hypothetical protein
LKKNKLIHNVAYASDLVRIDYMIKKFLLKKILVMFKYLFILKEDKLINSVAYASEPVRNLELTEF